ncbi:MAG: BamA/TamA family outer membrane protein [Drouetiella hepatica Uher 2000/2452]|uniref:BamA/TamA family outer membrane protein n=1 Tax=Drouetiella hepatica Uher 2000/2452 TaxID=904376 RepID=A0A951UQK8_9CYAN|nr:BamA/TamA family outer membrane protein [Drouetiella hepatica Uher 2000/2452]
MRFSPVLFAVLTASTAIGLVYPTEAKASDALEQSGSAVSNLEVAKNSGLSLQENLEEVDLTASPTTDLLSAGHSAPTVSAPDRAAVEFFARPQATAIRPSDSAASPQVAASAAQQLAQSTVPLPELPAEPTTPSAEPTVPPVEPTTPSAEPATPSTVPAPATPGATPPASSSQPEARVLVAEVAVSGTEGDLLDRVYNAIRTQPGRTTTRSQLQEDINAVFATGYFANVRAVPEDTPLGVRITFEVQPNPVLQSVRLQDSVVQTITYENQEVPLQQAVDGIFGAQYGNILNLNDFQDGVEQLNKLYQDNGYVLAQIVGAPQVSPDGTATLEVAEGIIEDIQIRFLDRDGNATDDDGNPIEGKTRDFIITREFDSEPGDVFNQSRIQADLQRAFGLGIFEDLQVALNPGEDPRKVNVVVNVTERRSGSIGASLGVSSADGVFGAVSLQEQNLGGNNQTLSAEVQAGLRSSLQFDASFTDPWIAGDPNRTSYTVNAFGRQSISLVFDGGENEVRLPDNDDDDDDDDDEGDRPRVYRFGGGVSFSRPLDGGWRASLGLQYQNVSIRDADGDISPRDELGNLLSFNSSGTDNILSIQASAVRDRRNSATQTTSGSLLRFSDEQTIPIDGITFNRIRGSYSYFIPVRLTQISPDCRKEDRLPTDCPETLAFNVQGGTILGDLPPYEAFSLGGTDSVRGYQSGELGSGRSFVIATAEYRFPIFSIVGGALFVDAGTDLGTASDVPGNPAGVRDKPGSGFGYGIGIRIRSPIGQIRVDYAINDQGDNEIHFGIGERF